MISRAKKLLVNITILTATSLFIQFIAFALQVWLVKQIGSKGIGLFQLVMSVSAFASTFAISGINYAAVRLISEEIGMGRQRGVGRAVRHCMVYALFFGALGATMLFIYSERIAFWALGDMRTVMPIRLLAVTLPLISLSTVMQGYFTAVGRVYKTAVVHIAEQVARVFIIMFLVKFIPTDSIESACAIIVVGSAASELLSFIFMLSLYVSDRLKYGIKGYSREKLTARMITISMPIAVISYTKTALFTLQNLLIPSGLIAAGYTANAALAKYGLIQGMVMPIIYFPSCVLFATSELIVPDMTEAQVAGDYKYISRVSSSLFNKCLLFAVCIAGMTYIFAENLSFLLYGSSEPAPFIRVFSIILPVIYLNMMMDGLLRGLGQQSYAMICNIVVAAFSVVLIKIYLPIYALKAYIVIFFIAESLIFILGFIRLNQLTEINLQTNQTVILSVLCAIGACLFL